MLHDDPQYSDYFDAVVMLTWSNWWTEARSNRYHYATRFAKHLPVIFVQADLKTLRFYLEPTGIDNLTILHVWKNYSDVQSDLLQQALSRLAITRPLLWIYNSNFKSFIDSCRAPFKVFHATEAYYHYDLAAFWGLDSKYQANLRAVLQSVDLLIPVSDALLEGYVREIGYSGASLVLKNGCDYKFWIDRPSLDPSLARQRVAIYQGGINYRLDWNLLYELIKQMPDWEFWFCGQDTIAHENVSALPNAKFLGNLAPEQVRALMPQATVGLIPFVQEPYIYESLPLKAFEYVAVGLPVVSVPIRELMSHPDIFRFASDVDGFARATSECAETRFDPILLTLRDQAAKNQDYDQRFEQVFPAIQQKLVELPQLSTSTEASEHYSATKFKKRPLALRVRTGIDAYVQFGVWASRLALKKLLPGRIKKLIRTKSRMS